MVRNRVILFVLVLALAAASFGFSSSPITGVVAGVNGNSPTFQYNPPECANGYSSEMVEKRDSHNWPYWALKCTEIYVAAPSNNNTPLILNNLVGVKVSAQLAGVLALFEQPAGTVVSNVSGLYVGTTPPYYEVTLVNGNYVRSVYVDAWNGSILPPQYNHPSGMHLNIYYIDEK